MNQTVEVKLSVDELEGTQATLAQWLVNIGDDIQSGQPIAELETDKVNMEICAPTSGVLNDIIINVGESVEPDNLIATLITDSKVTMAESVDDSGKSHLSPAVRRLLKENNLNEQYTIQNIQGSGKNGRVTRHDIEAFLTLAKSNKKEPSNTIFEVAPKTSSTLNSQLIQHSTMRKTIAKHMVESLLHTAPHVTSVFEMNLSNVIEHRKWHKKEYQEEQVNLTFTAYFLKAICAAMKIVPTINARYHDDALEVISDINIGVGTGLGEKGLVVPVIEQVQEMKLFDIAKQLTQQTQKARSGSLKPADLKNGTFTISNHGVSGSLFAAPIIINQPEIAILGIGKLKKRTLVVEENGIDTIQIKPMCYVTLSIDHRALDAYQANLFLSTFVETIEHWS